MLLVEEALVVEASVERGARVLHIGAAIVAEIGDVIAIHLGSGGALALHRHGVDLCRQVQGTHLVELIAQRQASHREGSLHFIAGGHDLRHTVVLDLFQFGLGIAWLIV